MYVREISKQTSINTHDCKNPSGNHPYLFVDNHDNYIEKENYYMNSSYDKWMKKIKKTINSVVFKVSFFSLLLNPSPYWFNVLVNVQAYTLFFSSMPKLIVHNLWAVRMHHWLPREVAIGAGYKLIEDCLNLYDKNAIAVFDGPNKKAFLKRDCVIFVKFMFEPRITN